MGLRIPTRGGHILVLTTLLLCLSGGAGFAQSQCPPLEQLVPVFEQRASTRPDTLLTTDPHEGYLLGYQQSRMAFYALPADAGGVCPASTFMMQRLFNPFDGGWFYTSDPSEFVGKQAEGWYPDPKASNFCVADKDEWNCGLVPLMRLNSNAKAKLHRPIAYTTSMREERDCILTNTCAYDPTTSYTPMRGNDAMARVWPKPVPYVTRHYASSYAPLTSGAIPIGPIDPDLNQMVALDFPPDFQFSFYGRPRTKVYASTNGLLSFDGDITARTSGNQNAAALPGHMPPYNIVAGWWQPSITSGRGAMLTQVIGTAPNRHLVVQWGRRKSDGSDWVDRWATFPSNYAREMQIHLVEGSNNIEMHYGFKDPSPPAVPPATVGVFGDYGIETSQSSYTECMSNCTYDSWYFNGKYPVTAFIPEPHGYNMQEILPPLGGPTPVVPPLVEGWNVNPVALDANGQGIGGVSLGFQFHFDGQVFDYVYISSAGAMGFTWLPGANLAQPTTHRVDIPPSPAEIADADLVAGDQESLRNVIAPWWDRLAVDVANHFKILHTTTGAVGSQQFTVEWQGLQHVEDQTDNLGVVHHDLSHRRMRVILSESDNSITVMYLENGRSGPSDWQFDTASAGIINADRDGTAATFRILNCSPNCLEGTRTRTVRESPGSWPAFTTFKLTPDTKSGPTWHDVYRTLVTTFSGADACVNCHVTLTGAEYMYSAAVLGQPPIARPEYPTGCVMHGFTTTEPLITLNAGKASFSSWFTDTGIGLSALSEPGGGYNSGGESSMPWSAWCRHGSMPDPSMQNDALKTMLRRWVVHDTP